MHCSECPGFEPDTRSTNFPRHTCGFTGVAVSIQPSDVAKHHVCPANIGIVVLPPRRNHEPEPPKLSGGMRRVAVAALRAASDKGKFSTLLSLYEPHEQEVLRQVAVSIAISDDLAIARRQRQVESIRERRSRRRDAAPAQRVYGAVWGAQSIAGRR